MPLLLAVLYKVSLIESNSLNVKRIILRKAQDSLKLIDAIARADFDIGTAVLLLARLERLLQKVL